MMEPLLSDGTVRLRAIEPEDLDLIYELENDTTLWDVSSENIPHSLYAIKQYITDSKLDIFADLQLRLVAEDSLGHSIGFADICDLSARHSRAEVGLVIKKEYRGKGFASKILQLLEKYSFAMLSLHSVYAYIGKTNIASQKLFLNNDYKIVGCLADWIKHNGEYEDVLILQKTLEKKS